MPAIVRPSVVTGSVSALVAGLLYGAVAPAASADEQVAPTAGEIAGIETVGPIPTITAAPGERWPALPQGVAVMPRGSVLNGDFPLVYIPALRTVDSIDVRVRELSSPRPDTAVVDERSAEQGWFTVGDRLTPGAEYAVDVVRGSGDWAQVGSFHVSGTAVNAGPTTSAGSMAVSTVTGRVSWGWQSRPLPGPAGSVGIGLQWASAATASPGLPEGWRLTVSSGSPWMGLEESPVDAVAVDAPMAPSAKRTSSQRVSVDFAYPEAEAQLVTRFLVQGRTAKGRWKTLARMDRSFAKADVDAIVPGRMISRVRIGAVVEGTTVWGPATRVRRNAAQVTRAPLNRHLTGAESGSLATPGDLPSTVRLVGWDGSRLTFVRNAFGVYEQTGGETPGFANGLVWIGDGEWEFAALDGTVTRFVDGRAVSVTTKGTQASTLLWSSDRLDSVVNEVGRALTLHYSGDSACPAWSGFDATPSGMLCAITYPGGDRAQIGYVAAGDAPQIALIKEADNSGETLGWDTRGRLVATRSALVSQVGAIDPSVLGAVASVAYGPSGQPISLTQPPGSVGAATLTKSIDYPVVTEGQLRSWVATGSEADAARTTVTATGGGYSQARTTILNPVTWQTVRVTAPDGLNTFAELDDRTGQIDRAVDAVGRVTTFETDELGQVTAVTGPSTSANMAMRNTTDYDTERIDGRDRPLAGLRAQVYSRDVYAGDVRAEFWESDYTRGGLSGEWSGRGSQFSAQASGVWTPPDRDDAAGAQRGWDFEVSAAQGTDASLVIGGVICPASGTICRVDSLPRGPKAVVIQISDSPGAGWFSVSAAPRGQRPQPVDSEDVRPGYGLTTVSATNDDLPGGTDVSRTEYAFADPASGQLSSVRSPGGLVSRFTYEPSTGFSGDGSGRWGRLLTRTTPGGQTQTTSYWPDTATVSLPVLCGGASVEVSGQPRTLTRQDGSTVTTYFDIVGRAVAMVSSGGDIVETGCTVYRSDGAVASSTIFVNGDMVEKSEYLESADGDPRVLTAIFTTGPGSSSASGVVRERTTRVDLLGRPVEVVGIAGETTRTVYDAAGNITRMEVVPPAGAQAAPMTFDYSYDRESNLLSSIAVNGVTAARITRDPLTRQITSWDYAGVVRVGWDYSPDGRLSSVSATADGGVQLLDQLTFAPGGRILGRTVTGTDGEAGKLQRGYAYDAAGRLATVRFSGDITTSFDYTFAGQDASCPAGYSGAGRDGLRTGGSRDGSAYTTCYDSRGRLVSTTDPLIAGESGIAELTYDGLGRIDRITGPRALAIDWSTGTEIERLHEISADGSGLVSTRFELVDGAVLDKTVATDDGSATVRYAGSYVLDVVDGQVTGTASIQYGLPGGASIATAPGTSATLTIPGTDGSALVRVDVPALGFGASPAPGGPTGVAPAYGPYGEPLVTPSIADAGPLPQYSWQAAARNETLPGTASVTLMGDRPYHPALGVFLAPDPVIDSGDNLYSYTSGDPINFHDSSGQEESSLVIALGVTAGAALLASFGGGYLAGRFIGQGDRVLSGIAKASSYVAIGAAALTAAGATYVAVKGQTADFAIAVGVAVGTAIVATAGSAMLAKWQAARPTRLFKARVAQRLANSSGPDGLERAAAVNAPARMDRSLKEAAMRATAKVNAVNPKAARNEIFYIYNDAKTMQRFRDEARQIVARADRRPITKVNGKRVLMGVIREVDEALEDAASAL